MDTPRQIPVQTFLSFQSQDRDDHTWPNTNKYQINIPKFHGVTSLKLASFEMASMPQYTIEEDTNDLLYLHDGCIIGCSEDDSVPLDSNSTLNKLYENQLLVSFYKDNSYNESTITIPSYDNVSKIEFSTAPSIDSSVQITVNTISPHGLHSNLTGCRVWLTCGPFEDVLVASESGMADHVSIINSTSFSITVTSKTNVFEDTIAILHCEEISFRTLSLLMNSYPLDNSLIKMTTSFSKGCFNFQVASNHALDKVRLNYSGNRFELNGNPRGLGFSIGCPNGYFTSKSTAKTTWVLKAKCPEVTELKFPEGILDISSMGSLLSERLNSLNLTHSVDLGMNAFQFGVTTHLGITIAIRIPCGKYSILSLTSAVELKLAAATGSTWNLTYDNNTQKFKITSSDDFTFHFGASAEINSGWYTSTGAPSNNNATVLMARYLGFVPNCSYYSINKTLESVVKSSFPMYQKYPRYSKLNDPRVPSMSHTESTSSTRLQKYNYVVGSRDPPTRKIGIGCRHTSCITCSLTNAVLDASSGSSYLDNADAGAMYSITLQSSGYTFTPPFAQQVGTFVKLSNTSTSRSATAQVASVGTDSSTITLLVHKDIAEYVFNISSATLPITTCNLVNFGIPQFSLLAEDGSKFRKGSISQRIGLMSDTFDIGGFSELQGSWNVEHPPSLLLKIEAIGSQTTNQPSSMVQANNNITSCLARIMIRSNGVVHVNSMGPQEINFSKNNIDKLQIELLNNDGTPYESHQLNHNISLVVTYFQG
tara:strand:- start:111 stop:2402 length:2292 start_codon:yes stop_codon:yes gene_type:complete